MTPGHPVGRPLCSALGAAPSASYARALSLACGSWGRLCRCQRTALAPKPWRGNTRRASSGSNADHQRSSSTPASSPPASCAPTRALHTPSSTHAGRTDKTPTGAQSSGTSPGLVPGSWRWERQPAHAKALCSGKHELLLPPGGVHAAEALGRAARRSDAPGIHPNAAAPSSAPRRPPQPGGSQPCVSGSCRSA